MSKQVLDAQQMRHLQEMGLELKGIESEVEMFAYLEDLIPNTED